MRNTRPYMLLTATALAASGTTAWLMFDHGPALVSADSGLGVARHATPGTQSGSTHRPLELQSLYETDPQTALPLHQAQAMLQADPDNGNVSTEDGTVHGSNSDSVVITVDLDTNQSPSVVGDATSENVPAINADTTDELSDAFNGQGEETPVSTPRTNVGFKRNLLDHKQDAQVEQTQTEFAQTRDGQDRQNSDPAPAVTTPAATAAPLPNNPPPTPTTSTPTPTPVTAPTTQPETVTTPVATPTPTPTPRATNDPNLSSLVTNELVVEVQPETQTPLTQLADPTLDEVDEHNNTNEAALSSAVDQVVSWFTIGWSSTNPNVRHIGRNLDLLGWEGFVRRNIEPQVDAGIRRFMLHNPWGALEEEVMQLDQYLHAKDANLRFVTERFVESWLPITNQGIEVIGYVGSGRHDPDFDNLDREAWIQRGLESVQPLIDAGMSVGLDAAAPADANSYTYAFAKRLREMGVKVYVEAKPTRFNPHWFDYGVVALDGTFLNDDIHTGHPQAQTAYGIENSQLTGGILRITKPRRGESIGNLVGNGQRDRVREIIRDGHAAVTNLDHWFATGRTFEELLPPETIPSFD